MASDAIASRVATRDDSAKWTTTSAAIWPSRVSTVGRAETKTADIRASARPVLPAPCASRRLLNVYRIRARTTARALIGLIISSASVRLDLLGSSASASICVCRNRAVTAARAF